MYDIYKWEFDFDRISEQLESFHGVRDIHLGVAFAASAAVGVADDGSVPTAAANAKVELLLERVGAVDVDPAAVVGVEEVVDGHVAVLGDRREMRLLLLAHVE